MIGCDDWIFMGFTEIYKVGLWFVMFEMNEIWRQQSFEMVCFGDNVDIVTYQMLCFVDTTV